MEPIKEMFNINFSYVLISVFVILVGIKSIVSLAEWIITKLGLETKWMRKKREEHELLTQTVNKLEKLQNDHSELAKQFTVSAQEKIINRLDKIEKSSRLRNDAIIEEMCDRIGQKTRYYINTLHGIPEDEYDDFVRLFNAYEEIGGNHGAKKRYEYCINHLEILPVKKETIIENE